MNVNAFFVLVHIKSESSLLVVVGEALIVLGLR